MMQIDALSNHALMSRDMAATMPLTIAIPRGNQGLTNDPELITKTAENFEAVFLRLILKEMMPKEGSFFGKETGSEIYKDLFVNALADQMAHDGVMGVKDIINGQLRADLGIQNDLGHA